MLPQNARNSNFKHQKNHEKTQQRKISKLILEKNAKRYLLERLNS